MKIKLPDGAITAITIADLAASIRTIKSLKLKGMSDTDDKKMLKALDKVLRYYCTTKEYEALNLEGCTHEYDCNCGFE